MSVLDEVAENIRKINLLETSISRANKEIKDIRGKLQLIINLDSGSLVRELKTFSPGETRST